MSFQPVRFKGWIRAVFNARGAVKWPRCIMECFRPIRGLDETEQPFAVSVLSIVSIFSFRVSFRRNAEINKQDRGRSIYERI